MWSSSSAAVSTGLSAAYELAARGVPFVLLEASERTGGLVHTDHVEGFTIDAGADSMLADKPAAFASARSSASARV